jgi:hypothetical protein
MRLPAVQLTISRGRRWWIRLYVHTWVLPCLTGCRLPPCSCRRISVVFCWGAVIIMSITASNWHDRLHRRVVFWAPKLLPRTMNHAEWTSLRWARYVVYWGHGLSVRLNLDVAVWYDCMGQARHSRGGRNYHRFRWRGVNFYWPSL